MAEYTVEALRDKVRRFGEVFVHLDSGKMYQVHGTEQLEFSNHPDLGQEVRFEGYDPEQEEWVIAEVQLEKIEHVSTHREV